VLDTNHGRLTRGRSLAAIRWAAEVTIEQLGSIGEIVGALATVATLLYLAVQIRQNTTTVRSAATSAYVQGSHSVSNLLVADPELCDLYYKGLEDPGSLTDSERRRFVIMLGTYLMHLAQAEQMESAGTLPRDLADQYGAQLDWLACQPGFQLWRELWGDVLPASFTKKIKEATARGSAGGRLGVFTEAPGGQNRMPLAAAQQGAAADRQGPRSDQPR
jgi:hypothetical protein